ncbi:hypothetical protein [Morganella phage Mecenats66]|nr:hypothetical protein [Morganella phage Mecenats66]
MSDKITCGRCHTAFRKEDVEVLALPSECPVCTAPDYIPGTNAWDNRSWSSPVSPSRSVKDAFDIYISGQPMINVLCKIGFKLLFLRLFTYAFYSGFLSERPATWRDKK